MVRMRAAHEALIDREDPVRNPSKLHTVTTDIRDDITRMIEWALAIGEKRFLRQRKVERNEKQWYLAWKRAVDFDRYVQELRRQKQLGGKNAELKGTGGGVKHTHRTFDHWGDRSHNAADKGQPRYQWLSPDPELFKQLLDVSSTSGLSSTGNPVKPQTDKPIDEAPKITYLKKKTQMALNEYQRSLLFRLRKAERYIQDANVEYRRSQRVMPANAEVGSYSFVVLCSSHCVVVVAGSGKPRVCCMRWQRRRWTRPSVMTTTPKPGRRAVWPSSAIR
jgi:hypothetical protein